MRLTRIQVILLVALMLSLSMGCSSKTEEKSELLTPLGISKSETDEMMLDISEMILKGEVDADLPKYRDKFDPIEYISLMGTDFETTLRDIEIEDWAVHYIGKPNSSTNDTVIFVDMRCDGSGDSNMLYLFEFHVNSNGQLYGHNFWRYT